MSQTGYTPIQLYYSTTAAAVPVNTNLASGELAINITDGKLYYKDNGGTVKLLASNATSAPVTSFQTSLSGLTPSTATTGAVTLAGTLGTANGGTGLTSFTSGGVVYASSTSALATGSALTFDGTHLFLTTTNAIYKVPTAGGSLFDAGGNNGIYILGSSNYVATYAAGSEQMRLTSTGLGIGTSSPAYKLDVRGSAQNGIYYKTSGTYSLIVADNTSTTGGGGFGAYVNGVQKAVFATSGWIKGDTSIDAAVYADSGGGIQFFTNNVGTARAIIDTSGNLGLGVTPSAWYSTYRVLEGANGSLYFRTDTVNDTGYMCNAYRDTGAVYRFKANGAASIYVQGQGQHQWFTSTSSGTAGDAISFTQAMTLDASGNLGIGTSSPAYKLDLYTTAQFSGRWANATRAGYLYTDSGGPGIFNTAAYGSEGMYLNAASNYIQFVTNSAESVRITSAGGFSVGTTANPGAGAIYATGNITAYYSDARLKTVSGKIENALDKVAQLSGVYYTNNSVAKSFGYDSDEVQVGVLAQDVEAVLPQIVKAAPFDLDADGNSKSGENYKTVQYERLVPLLIEAINELQAKVKALEAK